MRVQTSTTAGHLSAATPAERAADLAGRREVSFEGDPARRDRGLGRLLVAAARHLTPRGEVLFAQVAPGNAASLRVVGAAGFRPIGAEVLFRSDGASPT